MEKDLGRCANERDRNIFYIKISSKQKFNEKKTLSFNMHDLDL